MRTFKLSFLFLIASLFITACNKTDVADRVYNPQNQSYEIARAQAGFLEDDELIGPDQLDLQAVGSLLERANNAEDLEYLLNSEDGINNLDLNDDGYADYISVREFDERYDDERGFSLFSMFGPELIQEIAQIVLDRDGYDGGDYDYPGSRVLIRGNDYLYGDNYYYETDWSDRRVTFVDWVFGDRDSTYQSPYYYGNYPNYYEVYEVVETPVYLTRVEQYYYSPVFVQTAQPTVTEIRVDSPYREVSLSQAYMTAPKEQIVQRQQKVLVERTDQRAQIERGKPDRMKDLAIREDKQFGGGGNPNRPDKQERFQDKQDKQEKFQNDRPQQMREMRDKPNREERVERQQNQQRFERPQQQQKAERQQQRFERQQQQQQPRFERQQQPQRVERPQPQQVKQQQRFERQNQQRFERPQQQQPQQQQRVERPQPQQMKQQRQENRVQPSNGGGNPNKGGGGGGGNPNKGGGNPNNGGGGGKGKGKG